MRALVFTSLLAEINDAWVVDTDGNNTEEAAETRVDATQKLGWVARIILRHCWCWLSFTS